MYLIQDAEDKKFVALITDGTAINAINSYFKTGSIDRDNHVMTDRKSMRTYDNDDGGDKFTALHIPSNPFLTPDDDNEVTIASPPANKSDSHTAGPSVNHDETVSPILDQPLVMSSVLDSRNNEVKRGNQIEEKTTEKTPYQETNYKSPGSNDWAGYQQQEKDKKGVSSVGGKDPQSSVDDATSNGKHIFSTIIMKGEHGMGLDLGKTKLIWDQGRSLVLRFKDFPSGEVNPALQCNPAIHIGDVIIAVNDVPCETLSDAVKIIRGLSIGNVKLTLERTI